jgi:hypothetical protein
MSWFNWFLIFDLPVKVIDSGGERGVVDYMMDVANVGNELI